MPALCHLGLGHQGLELEHQELELEQGHQELELELEQGHEELELELELELGHQGLGLGHVPGVGWVACM
jgi:hypothetical protein